MGPLGVQEMIVIFLVALVLFGPKKLPELGKNIGKAITEFRRAQSELKTTLQSHMRELEKETESLKEVTRTYTDEIYSHYDSTVSQIQDSNSSQQYDSPYYDSGSYGSYDYHSTPAESNPSTVGATATQGAESNSSHEESGNGTVPRSKTSESGSVVAEQQPAAHEPESQPKPETAVS